MTSASPSVSQYVYDGSQKSPAVTVVSDDRILDEGTDYDASRPPSAVDVGKYTIDVIGKGNYTGSTSASYEIVAAPISTVVLSTAELCL